VHVDPNPKWLEIFVLLEANVKMTNEGLSNSSVKTCKLQLVYVCTITEFFNGKKDVIFLDTLWELCVRNNSILLYIGFSFT
jgi:hypothetical protein